MLFLLIISSGYLAINFVRNPVKGGTILLVAAIVVVASVSFLPDDSKTYRRITSLSEIDLTERTGSIGERQAEWDAIQIKLAEKGKTIEWFGLGFGGVYNVQFTHQYLVDYGHAHYAWAWFNLRFGKSGYIYMVMLMAALLYNMVRGGFLSNRTGIFVSFLCLQGFIYCFTHVNSVFLLSGLHFFHVPNSKKEDPELTHTAPP
ncbi:MAG: hypothetical protein DHS20C02_20070 [Micavibrio sp.]|nr:MAG: hypothetical protein DHS20C02_20070 [Micavibrio sp.]